MIVQNDAGGDLYRFAHDQVQQAALSLLPKDYEKVMFYLGIKLWKSFSGENLYDNIFTIANLLQHAVDLVDDQEERAQISLLFLEAGKVSMSSTAFGEALRFFDTGTRLIGPNH